MINSDDSAKGLLKKKSSTYLSSNRYEHIYNESIKNPEQFWGKVSEMVTWSKPWTKVLDSSNENFTNWYMGGEINACYNAVDRHVEDGNGSKTAIIYDSPQIGVSRRLTYLELQEKVSKLAGALADLGVAKGDKVLIYMPLIPETVIAMLATVRLGAAHSVVFGGFASVELSARIDHCKPKVIIGANCGIEPNKIIRYMDNINEAISLAHHSPSKCIIFQRRNITVSYLDPKQDLDWDQAIENAAPHPCVPVDANDTLYILYTSGTTGQPKGVQRPIGGHLATLAWSMKYLYGLGPNDVWWCASDFGWVVGHSYMCYAPLLAGLTSVIFEGKPTTTPDPSAFYRIIHDYNVNAIFTVPTVLRMLKKEDPDCHYKGDYNISSLQHIFIAGEHCDLASKLWGENAFNVPILNHWWQTETGHAITATCIGLRHSGRPTKLTTGMPFPGYQLEILREDGSHADTDELGRIVIKLPMPPGTIRTLFKDDKRFIDTYLTKYPGYYDTMDAGYRDAEGWVYVTARDDDIIKVAGHRLSTLAIENVILSHPDISHACVVAVPDPIKGEVPFCLFVMRNDTLLDEDSIKQELYQIVKESIGPVAAFKLAAAVKGLPQTRSGKICRKSISDIAKFNVIKIPSTIVDATVYEDIKDIFSDFGLYKENAKS